MSPTPNPRGDTVVRWTIAFGVIDTLAVMLRFFVRRKSVTKIGADDWMIMASLVPAYFMIVATILFIDSGVSQGGVGRHKADLTASEMSLILKYKMLAIITYGFTITAVKISILLLYQRMFNTVITLKRAILIVGFLCITWLCGNFFAELFLCSPMSAAWDPNLVFTNHCKDLRVFLVGIASSNMLLDVIILCMPLPIIWNLKLSTRKKLEVSGVFLLGSLTCISGLIRILLLGIINVDDFSYTYLNAYLWSHLEPATAIWCACLMTYRPFFADIGVMFRGFFGGSKQTPSSTEELFNRKESSSTGSDSDAWPSLE